MDLLLVTGRIRGWRRRPLDEFIRRVRHGGWRVETASLDALTGFGKPLPFDDIAIAGGDGTLHAALPHCGKLPIVVVPAGTGNDFARSLGIFSSEDAAEALRAGRRRPLDLAGVTPDGGAERMVATGVGVGLDGHVSRLHARGLPYPLATLLVGARRPVFAASLRIDDGATREVTFLSLLVANSAFFGGGFKLAPNARLDDRLLELVTIAPVDRRRFFASIRKARHGGHLADPAVSSKRCRLIEIEAKAPLPMHLDGEPLEATRLVCRILADRQAFYVGSSVAP